MVQIAGADHRLADRCERPLGGEQRVDVDPALELDRGHLGKQIGDAQLDRDLGAGPTADRLAVHLRQPADIGARVAAKEVLAERETEDAVAEERKPPVGVGAVIDPGRVGQRLATQVVGQRVEKRAQGLRTGGRRADARRLRLPRPSLRIPRATPYAGSFPTTKSTASPTVSIRAASASETLMP